MVTAPDSSTPPSRPLTQDEVKHLEMVQAVITRLAGNSFLLKGATVTITAALLGLAVSGRRWEFALIALGVVLALWGLDSYYLRAERLFRQLHDRLRLSPELVSRFWMGATGPAFMESLDKRASAQCSRRRVFFSATVVGFHGPLAVAVLATTLLLAFAGHERAAEGPRLLPAEQSAAQ